MAEGFARLVEQGKARAIGASNFTAERLTSALKAATRKGLPRYESLQPQYNLADRDRFEGALQDLCVKEDVGVICYYGLASGFLTGKYRSEADLGKSPRGRGVKRYLDDRGMRILEALDDGRRRGGGDAGAGRAGLADGPARRDRADRQRHQRRTAERNHRRRSPAAGGRAAERR